VSKLTRPSDPNRQYWLLKSEPGDFSFDDLWNARGRVTRWDGVRNYQARNYLRDEMKRGDLAFFYHSSTSDPGIVGIAEIVKAGYPDPKDPTWSVVDIRAVERFPRLVPLSELRKNPELEGMPLLQKGNRLSIQKVGAAEWNAVLAAAKAPEAR
jgi:predicted RNA-binding protein with PUA-like domain